MAEELRFPREEIMIVRGLLHLGMPVGEPLVRQIASWLGIDAEFLLPFSQLPLRAFRQKAICGAAVVRAADGGVEVPMAFSRRWRRDAPGRNRGIGNWSTPSPGGANVG